MLTLNLPLESVDSPTILCLGAHSDDLEIGAGALILNLAQRYSASRIEWVVFSGQGDRALEATDSAAYFTSPFDSAEIEILDNTDGIFPAALVTIKKQFEALKRRVSPDLILTHHRDDRHQDHRVVSDLTWQTFRNHLILEYEIPKYDGDLGVPNVYFPVSDELRNRKTDALDRFFASQKNRGWFTSETFDALMRLRGIECNSSSGYAEAFYCRKLVIG